jgi:ribosomal protein L20
MSRRNHVQALKSACRQRRRAKRRRREAWVRPILRAHRALDASFRLIKGSLLSAGASERRARRRPIQASVEMHAASDLLIRASSRLGKAARELAEVNACIAREPEKASDVPELLVMAAERWAFMAEWLSESADQVFTTHENVLEGLETGALVPERPEGSRPRIILAPRPVPIRAFLLLRQPRVAHRIAPLLNRRRRTPRPAAVRVPRRNVLGRAPPLVSVCLL